MSSKDYFQQVAKEWDEMRKDFFSEEVREKAYSVAKVKKGEVAADIGAGTGFVSEGLLQRGLKVIAVDESEAMILMLEKQFGQSSDFRCSIGESRRLPMEDESVNYAFANMYLHHVDNPEKAICEMARIIKPGGRVVLTDLEAHDHEFLRVEHHDRWMGFDREDICRWFKSAGLSKIKVDCVGQTCCAQSECGEKAAIGIFVAVGEK